jgi:hypothetical protein
MGSEQGKGRTSAVAIVGHSRSVRAGGRVLCVELAGAGKEAGAAERAAQHEQTEEEDGGADAGSRER